MELDLAAEPPRPYKTLLSALHGDEEGVWLLSPFDLRLGINFNRLNL